MMDRNHEQILRALTGDLSEIEAERLIEQMVRDPGIRDRYKRLLLLQQAIAERRQDSFKPHFSDRVAKRLRQSLETPPESLYDTMRLLFPRFAAVCLMLSVGLGTYNFLGNQTFNLTSTVLETLFGIPSVSFSSFCLLS